MNTKKFVLVFVFLLFVAPILLAGDYKKEIPMEEAMKAYCAAWIVETGLVLNKLVYNTDGTY